MEPLSEARIDVSIAPTSSRWPERGSNTTWDSLHAAVNGLKEVCRSGASKIGEVEKNDELTQTAKVRRITEIGLQLIREAEALSEINRAKAAVGDRLKRIDERAGATIKPPGNTIEALLHAEIRAHVRAIGAPIKRDAWLKEHAIDERVASAILSGPGFLSGMSASEVEHLRNAVETASSPADVEQRNQLLTAVDTLDKAQTNAINMIAERAQLLHVGDGWRAKTAA